MNIVKKTSFAASGVFFVGAVLSSSTAFTPMTGNLQTSYLLRDCSSNSFHQHSLSMSKDNDSNNDNLEPLGKDDKPEIDDTQYLDEISWRVAKVRLEEANIQRLLRRKPIKLDYETSRRWIQMNWAPKTKEEFFDLVANGNLRTPYISKNPEEYYGERGEWISWDHYLLGSLDDGKNETDNGKRDLMKWQ
mmetsp:Transcript_29614/g.61663  ORF Transcript_29614/g.61663 Transcript_29614/m.61663 type:complete len:190 (+) Transcript_29614:114-683(+)